LCRIGDAAGSCATTRPGPATQSIKTDGLARKSRLRDNAAGGTALALMDRKQIRTSMIGGLEIGFDACPRSGRTRLAHLHQQAPLRALFPLCTGMGLPIAVTTSTSGGFAGGDRMDIALSVGAAAAAIGTAQAAEKFYRSTGADTEMAIRLAIEASGWLEWLPQESILFQRRAAQAPGRDRAVRRWRDPRRRHPGVRPPRARRADRIRPHP
jgi:hypothetical protein